MDSEAWRQKALCFKPLERDHFRADVPPVVLPDHNFRQRFYPSAGDTISTRKFGGDSLFLIVKRKSLIAFGINQTNFCYPQFCPRGGSKRGGVLCDYFERSRQCPRSRVKRTVHREVR